MLWGQHTCLADQALEDGVEEHPASLPVLVHGGCPRLPPSPLRPLPPALPGKIGAVQHAVTDTAAWLWRRRLRTHVRAAPRLHGHGEQLCRQEKTKRQVARITASADASLAPHHSTFPTRGTGNGAATSRLLAPTSSSRRPRSYLKKNKTSTFGAKSFFSRFWVRPGPLGPPCRRRCGRPK